MTLVQEFKTGTYGLTRIGQGRFVEGEYLPGPKIVTTLTGSLQPLSPRDLQVLPEGYRVKQGYKLYTDLKLNTVRESGSKLADRVTAYGETFVVMSTERWNGTDLPYYKALLLLENLETQKEET